jgi:hypothetical protein
MTKGNIIGDLAMNLFGEYEEMTAIDTDGKIDNSQMIKNTTDAIKRGVENICEAAFSYNGLYCAVDIFNDSFCRIGRNYLSKVVRATLGNAGAFAFVL